MIDEGYESRRLRLTPSGALRPIAPEAEGLPLDLRSALAKFASDDAEGLFELAARSGVALPPELAWWREFAALYLTERCHTPEGESSLEPIEAPSQDALAALAAGAPPMEGAEYLTAGVLGALWNRLDEWLRVKAMAAGGLEPFLADRAPLWRQVGRVCFHLAENKKDLDYPFAFLATYAPRSSESGRIRYLPLSRALQEFAGEGNRKALRHLLTPIYQAAEKSAFVKKLLESKDIFHPLAWSSNDAYGFLREIPRFEESGVLVRVPDWWSRRPRPAVSVAIGSRASGLMGADSVLDFDIGVALEGDRLSAAEIMELVAGEAGLRLLKGRWVEVDPERVAEALAHWKKVKARVGAEGISFAEGMRLLAGAPADLSTPLSEDVRSWSRMVAGPWLGELLASLRSPESLAAIDPGGELRTTLRPYQETGLRWLRLLSRLGLGACLADDMGLGKTIQILALLLLEKKEGGPSILVLPASLLANWKAEIERFAPSLNVFFAHPSMGATSANAASAEAAPGDLAVYDLVATSYGMLLRSEWMATRRWNLAILDEAQAIKNPGSGQAKAVKKLRARARIALTGTPVENRLSDLWSLFDFLCPGLLGSAASFKRFAQVLERGKKESYAPLRDLVRPYILRRMKTDRAVIADLPEKTEVTAYCGLTRKQAALYGSIVDELETSLVGAGGMSRRGMVLATLTKLKQLCNHPAQLSGSELWPPAESGKFSRLSELCEEIASRQDKVLVFSQFREATGPLADFLAGIFGRKGLVLHGGTPVKKRKDLVAAFQDEDGPPFFVLSLKAGGTGLNLTEASHVIHFDRWWNPAVENQATDRAFRIGQKKNVLVHKFVCRGTVEEKIDELIGEKTKMAADILEGGSEAILTEMSDESLIRTLSLDLDRASSGA
jgi:superfamily II DNA or RNA helicase